MNFVCLVAQMVTLINASMAGAYSKKAKLVSKDKNFPLAMDLAAMKK